MKWWEAQSDFKKRQSAHFLGGWVIDVLILFIFIISFSLVMPIPTSDPLFICGHHSHPIKIPSSRFFLTLIANQFHPCFFHNEEEWKIGKILYDIFMYMAISVKINQILLNSFSKRRGWRRNKFLLNGVIFVFVFDAASVFMERSNFVKISDEFYKNIPNLFNM